MILQYMRELKGLQFVIAFFQCPEYNISAVCRKAKDNREKEVKDGES